MTNQQAPSELPDLADVIVDATGEALLHPRQAPSDPQAEAFMSKMEKELGVKFVDATPKEEYTAEDEAREKDIDWSKAEKVALPKLKRTEAPSEGWEREFDEEFTVNGIEIAMKEIPCGSGECTELVDFTPEDYKAFIRKLRQEAVLEAIEKVIPDEARGLELPVTCEVGCSWAWNKCRSEVLCRVEAIKKELTDPK